MAKKQQTKEEEIEHLRKMFKRADKNGDGTISEDELAQLLRVDLGRNLSDVAIKEMFMGVDKDGDGKITLKEFVSELTKPNRRQAFEEAFRHADRDCNGVLSRDEVTRLCREVGSYSDEEVQKMIKCCDKNNDGQIDYKEFMALV